MEKTDANDQPPKSNGDKEQPRSLPYSVETPYGFHLDLDFLKYVDDIEKGNTIRRVHIHRKAKQPKFSTLPRNFSLPESGSRAYASTPSKSWTATYSFAQRKASLGAEETPRLLVPSELPPSAAAVEEPSYRRKALLGETMRQAELAQPEEEQASHRGRPQLLRASSMPATLPPGQSVEEESQVPSPLLAPSQPSDDKGYSESPFRPVKEALLSPFSDSFTSNPPQQTQLEQQAVAQKKEQSGQQQVKVAAVLEHQPGDLPKIPSPWQNQHPTMQQLQVVLESGGEECDASGIHSWSELAKDGSALASALQLAGENKNHEKRELSISEITPDALKKAEDRSIWARENKENWSPQPLLCDTVEASRITALKQQIAILEEQLSSKKDELEQIRVVLKQQDNEIKEKEKSIKLLASSKAQLEEKLRLENTRETRPLAKQGGGTLQYYDAAVNTELTQTNRSKQGHDKGVNVNMPVPAQSVGCSVHRADNMNSQAKELSSKLARSDQGLADVHAGVTGEGPEHFAKHAEAEADIEPALHTPCLTELKIDEHLGDDNQNKKNNSDTQSLATHAMTAASYQGTKIDSSTGESKPVCREDTKQDVKEEEGRPNQEDFSAVDPIGQYVKKIQELLQEQWMCLEHGYPELASAIKQPASKLSSIQNQLVNSLNSLLSAYSTQGPADKENSNTQYQQLEISPTTSLKSIMKKKGYGFHAGGNGTKKNLQFVGVNGGYETTSSEDTSCEDSPSEGDSDSETERKSGGSEHSQPTAASESDLAASGPSLHEVCEDDRLQEPAATVMASTQHGTERCKPSEDFLTDCQLLSKHLSETRTPSNKHLGHVPADISQEWFRVSSRKSSSSEAVAAYLKAFEVACPQLLEAVVNLADGNGNTVLHYSISHSNFPVAKLLLDTGVCDVDRPNRAGYTAVMITPLASAETREDMEVVMKLLKAGNVNVRASQGGQTALMLAVSHDREDMVKALLSCRADVNLPDEQGTTALMVACQQGNADIVRLLLAQPGCDVTRTDKDGNSALSLAQQSAQVEIAALLQAHAEQSQAAPE
ncbi:KN motif and ankyrin repeat domain-containing protein 4 [Rhea pennata]|uniref:KN motif and ankyrin repeat domain-containing protein 4 n=1 Tax=Rhea pennata TaxID=8795 RepID=UPI002E253DFD